LNFCGSAGKTWLKGDSRLLGQLLGEISQRLHEILDRRKRRLNASLAALELFWLIVASPNAAYAWFH